MPSPLACSRDPRFCAYEHDVRPLGLAPVAPAVATAPAALIPEESADLIRRPGDVRGGRVQVFLRLGSCGGPVRRHLLSGSA